MCLNCGLLDSFLAIKYNTHECGGTAWTFRSVINWANIDPLRIIPARDNYGQVLPAENQRISAKSLVIPELKQTIKLLC